LKSGDSVVRDVITHGLPERNVIPSPFRSVNHSIGIGREGICKIFYFLLPASFIYLERGNVHSFGGLSKDRNQMAFPVWLAVLITIPNVVISSLQIYDWIETRRKKSDK
jgi:hypothetical protein